MSQVKVAPSGARETRVDFSKKVLAYTVGHWSLCWGNHEFPSGKLHGGRHTPWMLKARATNGVKWLVDNKELARMVESMPSRLLECEEKKGARTNP